MINTKLTDGTIPNLTSPANTDLFYVVDVSDSTDDPAGTSKAITYANLLKSTTDRLDAEHNSDGTHSDITATSVTATTGTYTDIITGSMDASGAVSGNTITADSSVITDTINEKTASAGVTIDGATIKDGFAPSYDSMARQAIINGNFDICQRQNSGTTNPASGSFIADRWKITAVDDGYSAPTLVHSIQTLTPGDIPNSMSFYRVNANGAGSGLGEESDYCLNQYIEHGTRLLCGANQYVTLSFYARSSIANKRIGVCLIQSYGSGGSPSAVEVINGANFTLTSAWTKCIVTFETNTLTGKTFGTSIPDFISPRFQYAWGGDYKGRFGSLTTEDFVGSGNIDITQVQLCSGSVALPFQPKKWADEFRDCQRYYQKSYDYGTAPGTNTNVGEYVNGATSNGWGNAYFDFPLPVHMRADPTVTFYQENGTVAKWNYSRNGAAGTATVYEHDGHGYRHIKGYLAIGANWAVCYIQGHWVANAEF
jgi:hypothetical protein